MLKLEKQNSLDVFNLSVWFDSDVSKWSTKCSALFCQIPFFIISTYVPFLFFFIESWQ